LKKRHSNSSKLLKRIQRHFIPTNYYGNSLLESRIHWTWFRISGESCAFEIISENNSSVNYLFGF